MLSVTTDYFIDHGDPEPYLQRISEAGFTHVHWCHHWRSDALYTKSDIEHIHSLLQTYQLILNDVHGSEGIEKFWYSPKEYARLAGVELVKNRIDFAASLGGDAIVMHVYPEPQEAEKNQIFWSQLRKTLDALEPYALERGVRIAVENLIDFAGVRARRVRAQDAHDNFDVIEKLFDLYSPEFLGTCYDSGHANLGYDRMERLDAIKDRLYCVHLHDNDGIGDDHRLIFQDTIRWDRLATLIADSVYMRPLTLEVSIHKTGIESEQEFLQKSIETGNKFSQMVESIHGGIA